MTKTPLAKGGFEFRIYKLLKNPYVFIVRNTRRPGVVIREGFGS